MFDRLQTMAGTQIFNYTCDNSQKWLLLVGMSQKDGAVVGAMQLYSVDKKISQPLEGHCGAFTLVKLPGSDVPSTLFSFASKTQSGKVNFSLHISFICLISTHLFTFYLLHYLHSFTNFLN